MDLVPALITSSDGSTCDDSSGVVTPENSPLLRPAHHKVSLEARLAQLADEPQFQGLQTLVTRADNPAESDGSCALARPRRPSRVCVIGAGYVGGPTAAVMALHNPDVNFEVVDRDPSRIARWKSAHLPIHEPGLTKVVRLARDGADLVFTRHDDSHVQEITADRGERLRREPNLFFTTDTIASISHADMIFLAVNTPTKTSGAGAGRATNMAAFDGAVVDVARHARPGAIIVEKSTVPCGTSQKIRHTLDALRPGVPFEILSNPEFLSEGTAIKDLMHPDRVIIGSAETASGSLAAAQLRSLYTAWIPSAKVLQVNAWSSELSKLVANAMLAQRISSINSISAICEATGANVNEVAQSIGMDRRIGPQFLKAGIGFGGSCFRKDIASLTYLAESLGLDDVAHYWDQVNFMNMQQRRRFARKVFTKLDGKMTGRKIALLGFAFKKNTGDARESPAVDVIQTLLDHRPQEIAIFDTYCHPADIRREIDALAGSTALCVDDPTMINVYADPYQACADASAVLVITDCDQFRNCPTLATLEPPATTDSITGTTASKMVMSNDTVYELAPGPPCVADCPDCQSKSTHPIMTEQLEWARIVYSLSEPKWVLDGRGILDVPELEKIGGVRVDAVGRRRAEEGPGY